MRSVHVATLAGVLLFLGVSCVERLPTSQSPCPCAEGWVCDKSGGEPGVCVRPKEKLDMWHGGEFNWPGNGDGSHERWITMPDIKGPRPDLPHHTGGTWKDVGQSIAQQVKLAPGIEMSVWAIWGSSAKDIYLLGPEGGILHHDGSSWKVVHIQDDLYDIWGSGPTDVFAVGKAEGSYSKAAVILHYDGKAWTKMSSGTAGDLQAVWGSGPGNVFAVGKMASGSVKPCIIVGFDGSAWKPMTCGFSGLDLHGVWGSGPKDVLAAGSMESGLIIPEDKDASVQYQSHGVVLRFDGVSWTKMSSPVNIGHDVWGLAANDVYLVGSDLSILHWGGQIWKTVLSKASGSILSGVWGSSTSGIFAVGQSGTILHFDGKSWGYMNAGALIYFTEVWGSSSSDVWAVGLVNYMSGSHSGVWQLQ